jgi:hypothetical protein
MKVHNTYKKTNKISSSPVKSFVGLRLFIDGGKVEEIQQDYNE